MALATMIEKLNEARNAYEAQKKALGTDAQKAIAEALAPLLPPGYALTWKQYTPYFNDGDACTFRPAFIAAFRAAVREPELAQIVGDDTERNDLDFYSVRRAIRDKTMNVYGHTLAFDPNTWGVDQLEALEKMWATLPEDFLESTFGDHTKVTIRSATEILVDQYDHD